MGTWLSGVGIFLLVLLSAVLFLLWLRVRYEFRCFRYDTAGASFFVGWAGDLVAAEIRYHTGAGFYWRLKWPFGGLDSQRSRSDERAAEDEAVERQEKQAADRDAAPDTPEEQHTSAQAPPEPELPPEPEPDAVTATPAEGGAAAEQPSLADYLRLAAYAIREGMIGSAIQYICRVWGRMTPRYARGEGRLGLGDPYAQGLLLGALHAALPQVAARLQVTFTEEVAEGHLVIGGGVRPLMLCWDTLRFITAAPVRKTGLYYWRHVRK